ncbi:heavy-metal-associated domain-containing protein [Candidatus Woesearchaeota archaeon]|nr:heavy-metal-associated domain-containing protein [Candidatus Woesearchaeota archaeon]
MKDETFRIDGMTCQSCVRTIEKRLIKLEGVQRIEVFLDKGTADIKYDQDIISLDEIKSKVLDLGYAIDGVNGEKRKHTFWQGLGYGLIPHIGCIAFIIGSVLGVTVLMQFFKPLLMNRYFFHFLIGISILFATLSSALYLRRNSLLSFEGVRKKWKYLASMYGSTVGINIVLFFLIFPLMANISIASPSASSAGIPGSPDSLLKISVDIPCPGHAPLISNELKTVAGVESVRFSFPNDFDVSYDSSQTSKEQMLQLEVFSEYPATVLDDSTGAVAQDGLKAVSANTAEAGSIGCGGAGGCGKTGCGGGCGGYGDYDSSGAGCTGG